MKKTWKKLFGKATAFVAATAVILSVFNFSAFADEEDNWTEDWNQASPDDGFSQAAPQEYCEIYGHVKDSGVILQNPTCVSEGIIQYHCAVCGIDMITEYVSPTGHVSDDGTVVKNPTTIEPGEIEYRCTVCGMVLREEAIPVTSKRDLPNAVFDTVSCALSNIPDNSTVMINGAVISDNASGSISLQFGFPNPGDYTIKVRANGTEAQAASDPQSIHTHKPAAPAHVQTVSEPAKGGNGYIGGVDISMEYSYADQDTWIACTHSSQPVTAGIYIVRYRATPTSVPSDSVEVVVAKERQDKPQTPSAAFDAVNHQLTNLVSGMVYSTNAGDTWTKVDAAAVKLSQDAVNQAVAYKTIWVKNIVDGMESDVQTVAVLRQAQPTGLSTVPATSGNNGVIKGVGTDMQYRKEGSDAWIDIGSSEVAGLSKGKYHVRRKAIGATVESNPVDVVVDDKASGGREATPTAQFNAYNMHIDGVSGCRISYDGGNTWTDKISNSTYILDESKISLSRGIVLYRPGNGSTTTDSNRQYIPVTKQPTPVGITATSATPTVPGTIAGVDVTMQYKPANQANWIDVNSNVIAVAAGTYYVRRHGYAQSLPSDWVTVVIKAQTVVTPIAPGTVVPSDTGKKNDTSDANANKKDDAKKEEKTDNRKEEEKKEPEKTETGAADSETPSDDSNAVQSTEAVIVDLSQSSSVDAEVFVEAASQTAPLVLVADASAVWSVAPADINVDEVKNLGSVDLGITENTDSIPKDVVDTVVDSAKAQVVDHTFDIKHEGDFGFKANLTLKVDNTAKGKYAVLYYYNKAAGTMDFIGCSPVNDDAEATFTLTHASSYAVIISNEKLSGAPAKDIEVSQVSKDDSQSNGAVTSDNAEGGAVNTAPAKEKKSGAVVIIIIIVICILIAALVFTLIQKKKIEEAEKKKHHKQY